MRHAPTRIDTLNVGTPAVHPIARIVVLAAAIAAFALTGCSGKPRLARLPADAVVLAFGDSLTHGVGAGASESYPAQLERRIGRKVVARGVPGETSAGGLVRLPATLDEVKPALLLLCLGGNDFLRRMDEAQLGSNLRTMVQQARARNIDVALIGVPKPGLWLSTASVYADIAKELRLPLEDGALARVLGDNRLKADAVHPNARGYGELAQAVERMLRERGAL